MLIDLPFDVQMAEIEFDIDTYEPLPVYKPKATRAQIEKALAMMQEAERPLIVAGGGVINADASEICWSNSPKSTGVPVDPDADGLGRDPRRPSADGRHGRAANGPPLRQRDDARVRLRAWHRQPLGQPPHGHRSMSTRRAASSFMSTSSRRRSAACSIPISASSRTPRPRSNCSSRPRAN